MYSQEPLSTALQGTEIVPSIAAETGSEVDKKVIGEV